MKTELPKTARDWQGKQAERPVVPGDVCDHRDDFCLTLIQQGRDRFAVIYGLQVKREMKWRDAAIEYGTCLLHALECAGKLKG